MDPLKMYFLLKMVVFHCSVSLPEGNSNPQKAQLAIFCNIEVRGHKEWTKTSCVGVEYHEQNLFHTKWSENPQYVLWTESCMIDKNQACNAGFTGDPKTNNSYHASFKQKMIRKYLKKQIGKKMP